MRAGFGAADGWIAEQAGRGDIVITADITLAARCLAKETCVLDPKGRPFTDNHIGTALGMRDLLPGVEVTWTPPSDVYQKRIKALFDAKRRD